MGILFFVLGIWYGFSLPTPLFQTPYSKVLEDREGRLLSARISEDGQWRFPEIDSLPSKYVEALVAFEDQRFFYHPGVDPLAMGRAVGQNLRSRKIVSGGSTISMQVIRLAQKNKPRTIFRKLLESVLATRLELQYSKKRILRLYASHAPFGGNVVGLDAASWRYFGKSPEFLSWAEAAFLAVLPNNPSYMHPGRNREPLLEKRNRLLRKLARKGTLDATTLSLAVSESLPEAPLPLPQLAPHLLDRAVKEGAPARLKTSIDLQLQFSATETASRHQAILSQNGIHNLAALIVHVPSGDVLAYVGNAPNAGPEHGGAVDVIAAPRSSGSIFKPFLYALALQEGLILPHSLLPDIPMNINGYRPENFHRDFDGMVPASESLSRSLNVPFVHLLRDYGIGRFHYQLKKLGLTTIRRPPDHYGLTLILGGAEASLWDLGGVYASMARSLSHFETYQSRYNPADKRPLTYRKTDRGADTPALQREAPVFDAGVLWHTFHAMQEVQRPESEGNWEVFHSSRKVAWKTGTSFGYRDAWSIGLTPEYLVAVWVGNADGEGRPGLVGTRVAAPFMFDLFTLLPSSNWFATPYDELQEIEICRESGWLAGPHCPKSATPAPKQGVHAQPCIMHALVHLDPTEAFQVNANCELPGNMVHRSWFVLPPLEEHYYRLRHPDYKPLPPWRADCQDASAAKGSPMQLIYPLNAARIYVPVDLDGNFSRTVFRLAHRNPKAVIHWHIDQEYLGSTQTFHHMELNPRPGKHLLTVVDNEGNRLEQRFEIAEKRKE
ncbi:MAG: penicillin-binding protein 1C [Haliscomenobacter sp.]|nr:penicillin-binding protein 1C [Haliscomenobacter sp.]